jgi:ubiquinone/menaquinone biosynthesis C-methylase UbiE
MHKFDIKNLEKLDNPTRRKYMPPFKTLERFGLKDSGIFLDIGCGIGYFTIPAAKILKNGKAIGIDILEEMLTHARERAKGIENIEFRKCSEYEFPIENNSVDYAMLSNVLHEIEDKIKYLQEVKRVLKDGGELFIIEWEKKETNYGPPAEHRISISDVESMCNEVGLIAVEKLVISEHHYGIKAKK